MTLPVLLAEEAQADLDAAHDWYAARHTDLAEAFLLELDRQFDRIGRAPHQFPVVFRGVRRALLRRFPYALFFREIDEAVLVLACFHASRDPSGWRARA